MKSTTTKMLVIFHIERSQFNDVYIRDYFRVKLVEAETNPTQLRAH